MPSKQFGKRKRNKSAISQCKRQKRERDLKCYTEEVFQYCRSILHEVIDEVILLCYSEEQNNEYDFEWGSLEEYERITAHQLECEPQKVENKISGYRIVEIDYFLRQTIDLQYKHSKKCTSGKLEFISEKRVGLVSSFIYQCNVCNEFVKITSEDPEKDKSTINTAAVWGTLSTGSTYAHLSELLSVMDIPRLPGNMFFNMQRELGFLYKSSLSENMELAGKAEHKLAIENGDVDADGIPYITVILDGGWSKRSYGHTFTANSGVAVIIGKKTGKLLFVGVRNKYCSICARAENKNATAGTHICFKNWNGSSTSMEQDIIVEGFNKSIDMHSLRYKKFIADGDSTVYAKIKRNVTYGKMVEKCECTNHCIKNFGKHLHNIKKDTKGVALNVRKLLTSPLIEALTKHAQKVIYANAHGDIDNLKQDLRNVIKHVFEDHSECKDYLCDKVGDTSTSKMADVIKCGAHHHLFGAMNNLLVKSHLLIDNETSNKAELYMSILARFNMGKRLNLIQRESFNIRSYLTGLRYNDGESWHIETWKQYMGRSPGKNFKMFMSSQKNVSRSNCLQRIATPRCKKRLEFLPKASREYGQDIAEVEISANDLQTEIHKLVDRLKVTNQEERKSLEIRTRGQFSNPIYCNERIHRLTASNFGKVIRRQTNTSCDNLVKSILGRNNFSSPATDFGKKYEPVAISKYEELYGKKITPSGLFVHLNYGFLAASPDGIISDEEIIEVKSSYKIASSGLTLQEAVKKKMVAYLKIDDADIVTLNEKHEYYFQIQGQLAVTEAKTCNFIVYSGDKNDLFTQSIHFDEATWNNVWLPKLIQFYMSCLAPEIILNRRAKNFKCREPAYILEAQEEKKEKQKKMARKKEEKKMYQ